MKHNWTYKKLGELVDVLNGYAFKSSNYVKDGIRVIRIANVQKGKIVDEAPAFYPLSVESELTRYMLHEDDILLSLTGNVGRVGLLPKEMLPAALNQRVACLRIKDDTLMFKFLYQFLNSDYFEQKCIESSRGIAQLNMSTEWLKDYPLPIPSLDEQQAIVRELDGINRLIDLQEEQLREYDRLAQSLFYTTFGDPATNPKGWEVKKLGEVAETTSGGTPAKAHNEYYEGGTIPWLRSGEVSQGLIYKTELFITQAGLDNSSAKIIPVNSVAIAMYGATVGEVGIIKAPMSTNQAVCSIFPNESVTPIYLLYFLRAMKPHYINIAAGGAQPNISQSIIRNTKLPLPPLHLQQTFAAQIEAIEQQKILIRRSLDETRILLAARMQYYFE